MEIDYKEIRALLDIRLKQIEQDALEFRCSNLEYQKIQEMKNSIGEILIMQNRPLNETPAIGKVCKVGEEACIESIT